MPDSILPSDTLTPSPPSLTHAGGGAGFIGSHIAKRMKEAGYFVRCVDWVRNEFMAEDDFCDEFVLGDLRKLDVAIDTTKDCKYVFNLAADMGGMGFIESNQSVLTFNNTSISMNMVEVCCSVSVRGRGS